MVVSASLNVMKLARIRSCVCVSGHAQLRHVLAVWCCVGFVSVVLSSIERRYRFSSVVAGLIASSFDMAVLVSVLFISYFGGRGNKPKWLGVSLIVQGSGKTAFIVLTCHDNNCLCRSIYIFIATVRGGILQAEWHCAARVL